MTIAEVIAAADDIAPNQYTASQKQNWLASLDGKIYDDLIRQYTKPDEQAYPEYTSADDELLIPAPYAADAYTNYLLAMIASSNSETVKYNQYITIYNNAYSDYEKYYRRTHIVNPLLWRY